MASVAGGVARATQHPSSPLACEEQREAAALMVARSRGFVALSSLATQAIACSTGDRRLSLDESPEFLLLRLVNPLIGSLSTSGELILVRETYRADDAQSQVLVRVDERFEAK